MGDGRRMLVTRSRAKSHWGFIVMHTEFLEEQCLSIYIRGEYLCLSRAHDEAREMYTTAAAAATALLVPS